VLTAGLSTSNKIGLAVVAAVFIGFALASSFLAPRRREDFPGRNGLSVFVLATFLLFAAMLTAVIVFGVESEAEGAGEAGAPQHTIAVRESEFRIQLPAQQELAQGRYTFDVTNAGKTDHDLVIEGPKLPGRTRTRILKPGDSAKLTVSLSTGNYTLYCSVDGHRQAGMTAKISVG
jgi:plastocyanin